MMAGYRRGELARLLGMIALAAALPMAATATAQTASETVTLPDGRKLAMTCVGAGSPTIVLDSGLGMPMIAWNKVMPDLGKIGRTCAYDRAGYVSSDPGPMPRDAAHVVDDMKAMLTAAKLPGPYVLVAQSLGGHHARLFAQRYPGEVAGVVLIDPVTDNEALLRASSPYEEKGWREMEERVRLCVGARSRGEAWSETDPAYASCGVPPKLPLSPADIAMAQAVKSESDNRPISAGQVLASYKTILPFPIIVLSADSAAQDSGPAAERAASQAVRVDLHRKIAATSAQGQQRTEPNGSHLMQWDKPEAVVRAVQEVVALSRTGQ